ncbi:hypothetical protein NNJEOMEG_00184 [Fundidesulfovibrio magnetotacticus]|uniref:Uncharacterized protein n=1 Tax=Fundidesulfovibrio magnetotacticus TaxID=2730080 RepID=A0A6V8LQF7_9BACT|nr:hypothetical protein [Fundidesulfovibrio magnetotacticus]GFK92359.1 hypothetical protein NNJEOMEG_00184 [Fundidesulfovibrio magnetotacticus]
MLRLTSLALMAVLHLSWCVGCLAQSAGGDALASELLSGALQQDGATWTDPARLGNFFSFDPTFRWNIQKAPSSGGPGNNGIVVGPGNPEFSGPVVSGPNHFAFDPTSGGNR